MDNNETYSKEDVLIIAQEFFDGDELAAKIWVEKFAKRDADGNILDKSPEQTMWRKMTDMASENFGKLSDNAADADLKHFWNAMKDKAVAAANTLVSGQYKHPTVVEVRPKELECDVVRFQNNKEKWVAFVGLLNGYPYEIFTGLQDDEEGIVLPKTVTKGKIIKRANADGTHRYDFQWENKRGYKTTVEGLSEKFNPEYWNYAKLISGVLRYRMPMANVIKLVSSLQLTDESINTWTNGVERALKKYIIDGTEANGMKCPVCGSESIVYEEGCLVCKNCGASRNL